MIVIKKEVETPKRQVFFRGILETSAIDCEEGLFAALLNVAIHHTSNYSDLYESAAKDSVQRNQRLMFLQLNYRKSDVLNNLKRYRSEFSLGHSKLELADDAPFNKNKRGESQVPLVSLCDSLAFALNKENVMLALYKKLKDTMHHKATIALFNYLIAEQCDCIMYLIVQ